MYGGFFFIKRLKLYRRLIILMEIIFNDQKNPRTCESHYTHSKLEMDWKWQYILIEKMAKISCKLFIIVNYRVLSKLAVRYRFPLNIYTLILSLRHRMRMKSQYSASSWSDHSQLNSYQYNIMCKLWIYRVAVNTKFTTWRLNFLFIATR